VSHDHHGHRPASGADQRWLLAAFCVVVAFMIAEVVAGLLAHSLALVADAGHMLTDAAALALAVVALRVARRPARGAFTYGFARVDALSGQASGITLLLLALWFTYGGVGRLVHPGPVHGGVVAVVAVLGAAVNVLATWLAGRADRSTLNVRGVLAHLVTDIWAFAATFVAGLVVVWTGWTRADAVATLFVAALMAWTGGRLVHAAGRIFLEAAPSELDPHALGAELVTTPGVAEIHDLHVWVLGSRDTALSAHVLVHPAHDCHEVAARMRRLLAERYGIAHVTLQVDHVEDRRHVTENCADVHGIVHTAPAQDG
jgi:cobalt-zinc-cadmium efflux system protein